MAGLIPLDGKLCKYTNVVKGWQNRYFILNPQQGILEYHITQAEALGSHYKPRGSLILTGAVIAPSTEDSFTFSVNATNGEVYRLRASNTKERQEWVSRLRAVAHHFTAQVAQDHPPLSSTSSTRKPRSRSVMSNLSDNLTKVKGQVQHLSTSGPNSTLAAMARPKPSNQNEVTNVNQHIPTQHNSLGRVRSDSRGSGGKSTTVNNKRPLQLSEVKQLQEAHEAVISADNYQAGLVSMLDNLHYNPSDAKANFDSTSQTSTEESSSLPPLDKDVLLTKSTSSALMQALTNCYSLLQRYHLQSSSALPQDAEISWVVPKKIEPSLLLQRDDKLEDKHSVATFEVPSLADPNDEIEDNDSSQEEVLGPVDEHKSIIMHLLSQLKLGMDLTKVTLPTFILEKRSLLEMYADFVGHTDTFVSISDGTSAVERMHRVLKFYLASFQSGRHGQTAKKPYNPIVGEVFQCSYYVPKSQASPISSSKPTSQSHHRVRFVAEQVSHHPPVSAFNVTCPEKKITLNSHIWTRSKFMSMNMSVGVVNIGQGTLCLTDHEESYIITYPSAYARSILTVPWSELGGKCTISCKKTGLTATVIFHMKPTYGGQPHRITAEVKNSAGFVSCRVEGKWNTDLEFSYYQQGESDGFGGTEKDSESKATTETVETNSLKTYNKFVRPLNTQCLMESRKLWQSVTQSLRNGDITSATTHKTELEDQQRQIEKKRQEADLPVPTVYFTKSAGKDYDVYTPKQCLSL
ncbi:unnamed protein product [Clavelina lepadiformis]|uniref:Oxysterol-binding protein n=1 Tax=Clavelina lepadiformis TaxID=159417 RepID=A0ABP0FGM5_CLALP